MQCPKCGQANPEGAKFCRECGAPFTAEIKCPQCASANLPGSKFCNQCGQAFAAAAPTPVNVGATGQSPQRTTPSPAPPHPASFASGRYAVKRFLGEGGKKKVYLAHDTVLDRDVAFALIKTEGLDDTSKARIVREAQAMARLGDHPHIIPIYDLGVEYSPSPLEVERGPGGEAKSAGQPFMVLPLMAGGDVEGVVKKAPDRRMPLAQALKIALDTCQGLEFAHGKGIIHRDIKPGNVWLTADGVAKIGDFGLALPMDHSRMTREGLMVGTVAYMPPEQATGGEITPRSDLYSLGAMLYEMVTGRPPFVGDDTVAIIGQHLNTPPVSPAWHRPDLPPALGVLIMRLLEKDSARRPGSAKEVREALEAVILLPRPDANVGATGQSPLQTPSPSGRGLGEGGNPIYRRAFVGREAELKQLHTAFDAALSGQGGLVMVVGEPGIGKTALTEQLGTYAALRGGKALVGHAYEEGSLSLPYLAFVEALRSYVLDRKPDDLKKELGTGAADVARIVSEVRDRVQVELRPSGDPEDDRYRLLQAVTGFLRNASAVQPLLIVLEDLHWADKGTLDLLLHVARNLQGARLLLIGTYRDVEVDRQHPLSGTLAELRRGATFSRVLLRGLTVNEVHRMISAIAGQDVTYTLAEAVHRQTEGNPLFIQEVLRYLVEEGLVQREDGRWRAATTDSLAQRIPEGLRDVIGKRLSRLSPEANRVLAVAAVIGRDFRLDTLQAVLGTNVGATGQSPLQTPSPRVGERAGERGLGTGGGLSTAAPSAAGLSDDALLTALEEAVHVGVLQDQSRGGVAGFRFAHAFFRQTLYEEMFAPRRIRLHQAVARALEQQYAARLEEHAAELADHFAQSSDPEGLRKAVQYAELAARRAMSVYAYGEAVRHLERALQAQEILDPDDRAKRCDLLLALGDALMPAGEPKRAADVVAEEAFALGVALGDTLRAARASRLALVALWRYGGPATVNTPASRVWTERADRYAQPGSVERIYADTARGERQALAEGALDRAWELHHGALELARRLGGPSVDSGGAQEALWHAAYFLIRPPQAPMRQADRLRLADEFAQRPRDGVSARQVGRVLWACGLVFLNWGQRRRAEETWQQVQVLAERTREPDLLLLAAHREGWLAVVDGHLEAALEAAERVAALGVELGAAVLGRTFGESVAYPALLHLDRTGEALQGIGRAGQMAGAEGEGDAIIGRRALALAHLGREDEARAALGAFLRDRRVQPEDDGRIQFPPLVLALEAALLLLNDRVAASVLAQRLRALAPLSMGDNALTCPARHLGAAAALLGEPEKAHAYYQQALEVCAKIRFRPEIALTRLQLAELLLDAADGKAQSVGATGQSPLQDTRATTSANLGTSGDFSVGAHGRAPLPTPPPHSGEGARGEVAVPDDAAFAAKLAAAREALSRPPDALRHEANGHLDFAIAEFTAMKMQPSLERALRHKGLLKS